MAPKKRARPSASASASPPAAMPTLTLNGGVPHHPSLTGLWRDEKLTDFAVCAEGTEFKAHRIALASSSGYFLNLFESGMRDSADTIHALQGISPAALKALLAFVYEGACEIDEGLLPEVLEAAARLVVDALKEACVLAIGARLTPSNALDVWRLADVFTLPALEKAAVEVALRGFEELPPQLATGAEVLVLVQEDRLVAKSEEAVFRWVARWWEAAKRPEAELLAVMKHVRFACMEASFLHGTVRAWPALDSKAGFSLILTSLNPLQRPLPRSGFGPRLIYVVGGKGRGDTRLSTVESYDPHTASWNQLASMAEPRSRHGCVMLEGKLFAVGGFGYAVQVIDTAEVYDPQTDRWQPLAKMSTARAAFELAAVGGKVYAIGGWIAGTTLQSVEAYDPQLGAWAPVASMGGKRMRHASVVLGGKIYTMGGNGDDGATLDTVEVYNPQADSWQWVTRMPQGRRCHAAAAIGGKIYVTGGWQQGVGPVSSVYVYDPQTDAWTQLASMSTARNNHTSAAVDGQLYFFGGTGAKGALSTTEVYDPASNSWAQGTSLTSAREAMKAVAL